MRSLALAVVAAGTLFGCAWLRVVEYAYADPTPLLEATLSRDLAAGFPGFPIQRRSEAAEPLEFEAEPASEWLLTRIGTVWVSLYRYNSGAETTERFDRGCERMVAEFAPYAVRKDPRGACLSPVLEDLNDPEGGHIPMGTYRHEAVIRKGRLIVSLVDRRKDHPRDAEPMNEVIRELARRMAIRETGLRPTF